MIDFKDLEDEGAFGAVAPTKPAAPEVNDTTRMTLGATHSEAHTARYEEACNKCRGTGTFYSYSGRAVGPCFSCKGKGKRYFKTSPETRQKGRESATRAKAKASAAHNEAVQAYKDEHAAEVAFLEERAPRWEFAASLLDALNKWGRLTEGQMAALHKCMARDEERAKQRAWVQAKGQSDLDLTDLPSGTYAVPGGDTRLKIAINRPRKNSRWFGTIFVHDGAEYGHRTNYGRQSPGQLYNGKCVEQLQVILADPKAAMAAYGKLTGSCGVCGRHLEDEESVARGIGPVCAKKFA